jgi:hypothetical protein
MATAVKKWQMHPIKQKKCQYLIYINQWLRIGLRGCKGLLVGVGELKMIISHHELHSIFISIMDINLIYCP